MGQDISIEDIRQHIPGQFDLKGQLKLDEHLEHLLERIHRKFNQKEIQHPCTRYVRYRTRIGAPSVNRRSFTEEDLVRFAEEMKNPVYLVIIPVIAILCIYSITTRWYPFHNTNYVTNPVVNMTLPIKSQSLFDPPTCPGGIQQMLEGKWQQRKMTPDQDREINDFLREYRSDWGLPNTLQRKDLLCGNASFAQDPKVVYRMFRALCSPKGTTPCCMNNKCVAKTVKECQCKNCLDLRQEAHAEYSDWVPSNHNCKIRLFKGNEACTIFDGMTVVLSGDSIMRQIYIAFQKILNHDMIWGSLKKDAPIEENDGFPIPSTEAEIQAFDNDVFSGYDSDIERSEVKQKPRSRSIPELYHNLKVPKFTAPSKPKFINRIITGVRQKTKSKSNKNGVVNQNAEFTDDLDSGEGERFSESDVSNSDYFLSAGESTINIESDSDLNDRTDTEAYQTATGSLSSPSKSSKVWSTPTSPVISGLVKQRLHDYSKLSESEASPELSRKGTKVPFPSSQSTPCSPSSSKGVKQKQVLERTESWLKTYFSQKDDEFTENVLSKGYVRALVEQINGLHHELSPESKERLLSLGCEVSESEFKEALQANLTQSKSDIDLKALNVKLNNENSDKMSQSFHNKKKSSSRKNSVDHSEDAGLSKSSRVKKQKPENIDIKAAATKAILQRSESLASQPMSPAELFDESWSDSDESEFDDDSDSDVLEEKLCEVQEDKLESLCEILPKDKLQCIAEELYKTEKSYVERLHLLDQVFHFKVIQENQNVLFMPHDAVNQMFSNIKTIYQFHHDFLLPQLQERIDKWEKDPRIGDLMKRNAPFLKLYTDYVKNFDNSMNLINYWLQKSSKFSSIIREVQKLPECANLTLQHHMLGPIQRVPRYELLLKDYIKHLPENSADLNDAQAALDLVTKAASHANEAMKKIEKFRKLLEIHQSLRGINIDFISPTRELIREGLIIKIAARSGEKLSRYLFLFNDLLLICGEPMLRTYTVKAQMDIESMETKDGDNLSISGTFNLLSKQKTIELLDEQTPEGEVTWYESLKKAVDDLKEKKKRIRDKQQSITNLESGLTEGNIGERAPRWIPDESATICMRCDASFTTFRRRHHCRGCGWVICSKCCKKAPLEYLDNKVEKVCQKCYNLIVHQPLDSPDSPTKDSSPKKHNILDVKASDANLIASYLNMSADKGRSWMKRYFAVHDTFVLYSFKSDQDDSALTALPLPGYQVEMVKNLHDKTNIFKVSNKSLKKNYYFETDHKLHTKKWFSILEKVVKAELPDITQRFSSQSTSSASSGGASSDTYNNNNNNSDISTDNQTGIVKDSDQTISKDMTAVDSVDNTNISPTSTVNTKYSKKTDKTRKKSVDHSKTLSNSKDSTS